MKFSYTIPLLYFVNRKTMRSIRACAALTLRRGIVTHRNTEYSNEPSTYVHTYACIMDKTKHVCKHTYIHTHTSIYIIYVYV